MNLYTECMNECDECSYIACMHLCVAHFYILPFKMHLLQLHFPQKLEN